MTTELNECSVTCPLLSIEVVRCTLLCAPDGRRVSATPTGEKSLVSLNHVTRWDIKITIA